jgi:hypothetical protein
MEYINLSANGIAGSIYGNTMPWNTVGQTAQELNAINNVTGNFGSQFGATTYPNCNYYPYEQAQSQMGAKPAQPQQLENGHLTHASVQEQQRMKMQMQTMGENFGASIPQRRR